MESTFLEYFTHEGRLKARVLQIAADSDPTNRIARLRSFYQQLRGNSTAFPKIWVLLLNAFLQADSIQLLTENDLKEFEEIGTLFLGILADANATGIIWSRLADVYSLRSDQQNTHRLLARIYYTPSISNYWRSRSIQELARRKLQSNEYISMYMDYIQWAPEWTQETEILAILTAYCSITFVAAPEHIKRARELIEQLLKYNITLSCAYTTLGLYHLLIAKDAKSALTSFEKAFEKDRPNELILIGLLIIWIQTDNYEAIDHFLRSQATPLLNRPLVQAFVQFSSLIQWLESKTIDGSPPLTTSDMQQLAELNLHQYIGDIFHTAYARLHLLEGNAREALSLLQSHIRQHPEQLRWHYYASWAEMQLGEKEALLKRYFRLVGERDFSGKDNPIGESWSICWLIACLLLDTDPSFDDKHHLQVYLHNVAKISPQYSSVIETRLALVAATYPLTFFWKLGDGSIEEDLEALRTGLGYAFYIRNYKRMKRYTLSPLFLRLPLADQKMWKGILLLILDDGNFIKKQALAHSTALPGTVGQGRQLLEDVALKYGYQRAALILAVHYVEYGLLSRAKKMLDSFVTATKRADAKLKLLYLYIARLERNTVADIGKSVQQSELASRAYYAQGCLYLNEAQYDRAASAFTTALTIPHISLPEDCDALARCAQFLAQPDIYDDMWPDIKLLNAEAQNPFLLWCAFLARLWYASPTDIVALWPNINFLFDNLDSLADETRVAIIQAIARACQQAASQKQAEVLIQMLLRLATTSNYSLPKQLQNRYTASAAYKYYLAETNHERMYDYLDHQLQVHPANSFLVILLALTYLELHDTQAAIYVLDKTIFLDSQPEQDLCRFLATLLKGHVWDSTHVPALLSEAIQSDKQSMRLVDILRLFASGNSEEICKLIFNAWKGDPSAILNVINTPSLLPYLCTYGARIRTTFPQLVELVQQEAGQSINENRQVMLARCFVIIGQLEQADKIWQALFRRNSLSSELAQESAVLLCHMAVQANNKGEEHSAVLRVREAVRRVSKETQRARLEQIAYKLELQSDTQKMLAKRFPGIDQVLGVPGRYYGFQRALASYSHRQARSPQLDNAWDKLVYEHRQDVQFLHMLAITYREYVLANLTKQDHQEDYLTINIILWVSLLCTDDFWQSFSQARIANSPGRRENLSNAQQEQLFEQTIEAILSLYITQARRAFTETRYNDAAIYLRCLYLCSQGAATLQKTLQQYKLAFEISLNVEQLLKVMAHASDILNQWYTQLLKAAEEALGNLDTMQESGKNYVAGMNKLQPFIAMSIPVKRVLLTALGWYNEWCYSIYLQVIDKVVPFAFFLTTVHAATIIADQLMPLCTKERGFLPENRALAQYLVWHSFIADTPYSREAALQEALQWDASNVNAQQFIKTFQEEEHEGEGENEEDEDGYHDDYDYLFE